MVRHAAISVVAGDAKDRRGVPDRLAENGTEHSAGKGLAKASIGRRLAAIVFAHRAADLVPPTAQVGAAELDRAMRGVRRDKRADPVAKNVPPTAISFVTCCAP